MEELFSQKKCLVAFVDILGVSAKIKNNATEAIQDVWAFCHRILKATYKTKLKIKIFSDNIFLCEEIDEQNPVEAINDIFSALNEIETTMINLNNSFVRGAVAVGMVHFEDNFVLGEALLKVYELESKVAIYPRIVIDESVFTYLEKNAPTIKKDFDGTYFYDFLPFAGHVLQNPQTGGITRRYLNLEQFKLRIISNCLNNKNNSVVLQKMNWLVNYIQTFCMENGMTPIFTGEEMMLLETLK